MRPNQACSLKCIQMDSTPGGNENGLTGDTMAECKQKLEGNSAKTGIKYLHYRSLQQPAERGGIKQSQIQELSESGTMNTKCESFDDVTL